MKKIRFWLATIAVLLCSVPVSAYNFEVDGIYYNITSETDLTVEVTYGTTYKGVVVIPEGVTYNGKTYSVTSIGPSAFSGCSSLTSVTIPNSVTSIGPWAFSGCSSLTSVTIPNSVTSIGMDAFDGCSGLTSITIPNSVTSIGGGAFLGCSGLTSITIPNSVTSIGMNAFYGCSGIKELIIEDGGTSINLSSINCPLEYVYIGRDSFQQKLFAEGNTLKTAVIGPKVTCIGNYLFSGCSDLTSITIPNSVTSIGERAFEGCSGLTSITIPNSVTSIGEKAFEGCSGLTSIYIPNSVTSIGGGAFSGCSGLTSIYIGNSVTNIEYAAFRSCTNLNTLTVEAKIPPTVLINLGLESQQYDTVKLQVPEGSKAMYQSAKGWKRFFNIEEFDPAAGIADITPDAGDYNLPIYNLQGTRMTEDIENLPTGIYIQGGKKIFIK